MVKDRSTTEDLQVIENFANKLKEDTKAEFEISHNLLATPKKLTMHFKEDDGAALFNKNYGNLPNTTLSGKDVEIRFNDISEIKSLITEKPASLTAESNDISVKDFETKYLTKLQELYPELVHLKLEHKESLSGIPPVEFFIGFPETNGSDAFDKSYKFSDDLRQYAGVHSARSPNASKMVDSFPSDYTGPKADEFKYTNGVLFSCSGDCIDGLKESHLQDLIAGRQKEFELKKQEPEQKHQAHEAQGQDKPVQAPEQQITESELEKSKEFLVEQIAKVAKSSKDSNQFKESCEKAFGSYLNEDEKKELSTKAGAAFDVAKGTKDNKVAKLSIFGKLVDWVLEKIGSKKSINAEFVDDLSDKLSNQLSSKAEGKDKSFAEKILKARAREDAKIISI